MEHDEKTTIAQYVPNLGDKNFRKKKARPSVYFRQRKTQNCWYYEPPLGCPNGCGGDRFDPPNRCILGRRPGRFSRLVDAERGRQPTPI